jgi:hypothetical protein
LRDSLAWMQQASSAAAWAAVSGAVGRAGPAIQLPFHSDGLRYAVSNHDVSDHVIVAAWLVETPTAQ